MSAAVDKTIQHLNELWLTGNYAQIGELFDANALLLPPNSAEPIVGRDAIVAGYRQFGDLGGVHEFEIVDLQSFVFGTTAICHMQFRIDFELGERRFEETGIEIYALKRSRNRWRIVWRTQHALTQAAPQNSSEATPQSAREH